MAINKISLHTAHASLNDVAKKFDPNTCLGVAGKHQLRLKDGVLFTTPFFDSTKFKATILRDPDARRQIREERKNAIKWLAEQVAKEYRTGTAQNIRLPQHNSLRGYQAGTAMLAHAAVDVAAQEIGLNDWPLDPELKAALLHSAREHVYSKGIDISPQKRIDEAKYHLLRKCALNGLHGKNSDQGDAVKKLFEQLENSTFFRSPDLGIVRGVLKLLESNLALSVSNLQQALLEIRPR